MREYCKLELYLMIAALMKGEGGQNIHTQFNVPHTLFNRSLSTPSKKIMTKLNRQSKFYLTHQETLLPVIHSPHLPQNSHEWFPMKIKV